jgi:signal peptidase II
MTSFIWKNKVAWLIVIVVLGVALDQGSKLWALDALTRPATAEELAQDAERRSEATVALRAEWGKCMRRSGLRDDDQAACETPEAKAAVAKLRHMIGGARVTEHGQRVVERDIVVVPGYFNFKYAENPAAAFSMTGSFPEWFRRPFLLLVSLLASVGIAVWYLKLKEADWAVMTAFPLIIAGAVGNLIDRARLAYVIDFLDAWLSEPAGAAAWLIKNANSNHWPTFNIADSFIVVGAILVILRTFRPVAPAAPAAGDVDGAVAG